MALNGAAPGEVRRPASIVGAAIVYGLFFAISLIFCRRFFDLTDLGSHNIMSGDPALSAWTIDWVAHALKTAPSSILDGNAFFPYSKSIALSEHMLSLALISLLISPLGSSPWFSYNILIFLAYFVSAVGGFMLVREWTGSTRAGVWAGIFWGFLFFRVQHISHIQILSFEWIPFCVLFLVRAVRKPSLVNWGGFTFFFLLQALVSWYLAVITGLLLLVVAACMVDRSMLDRRRVSAALLVAILCLAPLIALAIPYAEASQASTLPQRYAKTLSEGGIHLDSLFFPPNATLIGSHIPDNRHWIWGENTLYIGYAPLLLALAGCLRRWDQRIRLTRLGIALVVVGLFFATGFVLGETSVKLPLYYLARLVPPLAELRAAQRFVLLLYFGVMLLSSSALASFERPNGRPWVSSLLVAMACLVFLVEVYPVTLPFDGPHRKFDYTAIDRHIASIQKEIARPVTAIHYPIHTLTEVYPAAEAEYLLGSTLHHASIVNGFSGAEPIGWLDDLRTYDQIPEERAFELLRKRRVDLICLHRELSEVRRRHIVERFRELGLGEVVFSDDAGDVILRLRLDPA